MPETDAPPKPHGPSASDYLAAERTFLAWIRTGLAFMGFGFVVARFGLFLQELRFVAPAAGNRIGNHHSVLFGTLLILAGVLVDAFACANHVKLIRQLNRGTTEFRRPSGEAVGLAIFLGIVGLAMAIYLLSV
ncbi:MAG TPA: DUF202 domain-containing protein [Candidatus Aquilonibacter sp.]|nr:DUF202 domain-containing protein [Candidatus Aquilonibacter sp.]